MNKQWKYLQIAGDLDLKVDAAVPIFVKDAEDLFNEDLRPQNKPLLPFSVQTKNMGNA